MGPGWVKDGLENWAEFAPSGQLQTLQLGRRYFEGKTMSSFAFSSKGPLRSTRRGVRKANPATIRSVQRPTRHGHIAPWAREICAKFGPINIKL